MNCPMLTPNSDDFCTCGLEWRVEIDRLHAALEVCAGSISEALIKLEDAPMSAQAHLEESLKVASLFVTLGDKYTPAATKLRMEVKE